MTYNLEPYADIRAHADLDFAVCLECDRGFDGHVPTLATCRIDGELIGLFCPTCWNDEGALIGSIRRRDFLTWFRAKHPHLLTETRRTR